MPLTDSLHRSDAPAALRSAVAREQLRMLLAHTEVGALAATAFAGLVALALLRGSIASVPTIAVAGWFFVKVGVVLPRIAAAYVARRSTSPAIGIAGRLTVPLLALDGAAWGLGGAALMGGPVESWSLIAAFLCCVAAVATFGLQVRLKATAAYVAPMLAPSVAALLAHGGSARDTAALGLTVLLGLLLSTARRSERRVAELIELRLHSEDARAQTAEALALAKRHSQAKDRFLALVSHELRTPLHGILGLIRLTQQDLPRIASTVNAHHRLGLVEDSGLLLQRMVADLLDMSLMESGRLQLQLGPFHLLHEIEVISETYQARAPEVGVGFTAYIQPSLEGLVVGDSARIAQVLHNLLGNAFKFTPIGGRITLEVERIHGTSTIQFLVRDTGAGVPQEERDAIFEIFTQGSTAGARSQGVGLGLAISRQLARAMNGDVIWRPGGATGSAFVFTAELSSQLSVVGSQPPTHPIAVPRTSNYAGLSVHIAEDDPASALLAGSIVRQLGCELESFVNGAELVDHYTTASRRPDMIILDWDMPKLDGRSAAVAIRHHERRNNLRPVPIIGLSANPAVSYSLAGLQAGMTTFLTKPCAPHDLAAAITAHIGRDAYLSPAVRAPESWSTD